MKKYKIYICFLFILTLMSCKKFLDQSPLDKISSASVFTDVNLINANLADLYATTPFMMNENSNLVMMLAWMGGESYTVNAPPTWIQGLLNSTGGHLEYWSYSHIRNINYFIQNVSTAPIDTAVRSSRVAEARFLRAWDYFEMVKRYGGVPIITVPQSIDQPVDSMQVPRNSEKQVYDFIASECDAIAAALPEVSTQYGRITKYTALALKSRAMLYAGSIAQFGTQQLNGLLGFAASDAAIYYQKAFNASKAIVSSGKFSLYNKYPSDKSKNYQYIWLEEKNSETIFSKVYNGLGVVGHSFDYYSYPAGFELAWGGDTQGYLETFEAYDKLDGTSGAWDPVAIQSGLHTTAELFGNRDPRMFATLLHAEAPFKTGIVYTHNGTYPNGTSSTLNISSTVLGQWNGANWQARPTSWAKNVNAGTGFPLKKFIDETKVQPIVGGSTTDYIVYRYAETLLNLAEAAFELGNTTEALANVNLVRTRAGMPTYTSITRDQIRHERQVELMFEGHRFWDLRRWRIADVELSKVKHKAVLNFDWASKTYQVKIQNVDPVTRAFGAKQYYLPITVNRIANSPKLAPENPGY